MAGFRHKTLAHLWRSAISGSMSLSHVSRSLLLWGLLLPVMGMDPVRELVVVTWNVLADPAQREQRLPALLAHLRDARADVIAVQEASTWFVAALAAEPWAKDLRRAPIEADHAFPGGLAVFTRLPVTRASVVDLPSTMRRCGICVELTHAQMPLCFGVVHLDSYLEDGAMRAQQLRTMNRTLTAHPHVFLVGDFNFADGDAEEREVLPGTIDAWKVLHPDKPGFTWDIERSSMARRGSFPDEPSRRLDRVLVRSPHWRPVSMSLLGTEPVAGSEGQVFPSDHFGVRVVLRTP